MKGINTWVVSFVIYSGLFLIWTRENQIDQRTRQLMTMYKALHSRDDVGRLYIYIWWKEREEDLLALKIALMDQYNDRRLRRGRLITATRNNNWQHEEQQNGKNQKTKNGKKNNSIDILSDISHEKTMTWLKKVNLLRETESLLIAAQNNAVRTNHIKVRRDKTQQNSRCWLRGDRSETIIL